jgi:phosphoglycolate phosphatase-like HAD superfamily hydrolase
MTTGAGQFRAGFQAQHEFLVAVDSDGCAMDTMTFKHVECFTPQIIRFWALEAIRGLVEETEYFVNLYSRWRGLNRFPALLMVFDLLRERPEMRASGVSIPATDWLRGFVNSGRPQSNTGLEAAIEAEPSGELERVLRWSQAVNQAVAERADRVRPFPSVRQCLAEMVQQADVIVVSQMPREACRREWEEHGLARFAALLGGQELGSKAQQLRAVARGRYEPSRVLMVGDAPGDLTAAQANGALFFPIHPGQEDSSWQELRAEGFGRFLGGRFAGVYQDRLIQEFHERLPERAPWLKRDVC